MLFSIKVTEWKHATYLRYQRNLNWNKNGAILCKAALGHCTICVVVTRCTLVTVIVTRCTPITVIVTRCTPITVTSLALYTGNTPSTYALIVCFILTARCCHTLWQENHAGPTPWVGLWVAVIYSFWWQTWQFVSISLFEVFWLQE